MAASKADFPRPRAQTRPQDPPAQPTPARQPGRAAPRPAETAEQIQARGRETAHASGQPYLLQRRSTGDLKTTTRAVFEQYMTAGHPTPALRDDLHAVRIEDHLFDAEQGKEYTLETPTPGTEPPAPARAPRTPRRGVKRAAKRT